MHQLNRATSIKSSPMENGRFALEIFKETLKKAVDNDSLLPQTFSINLT
jgi:hypothetical protein